MGEVWESSSAKGGARLVLLALADFANDEGYCHPSVERLALKSALTERNVQLILRDLEHRGELVTLRGAGRGHVNAYWVLPPATVTRLRLEGKTAKTFHPLQALQEKVKSATETVKTSAERAKSEAQKVKPTSPRTVKNHQEPSRTNTRLEDQPRSETPVKPDQDPRTPQNGHQPSSADRATLGIANGSSRGSASGAVLAGAASRAWATWLASNAPPDWLEMNTWARWLLDLIGWQAFHTHRAPLLDLPDEVKHLIHRRRVSYAAARRIARLEEDARAEIIARVSKGELRGMALNLELDRLLGTTDSASNRLTRLRRALPKQLENPRVKENLEALERELGLP
jgi:hypothetical protein